MGFEPAIPGVWGYGTPAQYDAQRKLSKTSLKTSTWIAKLPSVLSGTVTFITFKKTKNSHKVKPVVLRPHVICEFASLYFMFRYDHHYCFERENHTRALRNWTTHGGRAHLLSAGRHILYKNMS